MAAKKPAKATKAKKTIAKKADSAKKAAPAKKPAVVAKAKPAAEPASSSEARGQAGGSADRRSPPPSRRNLRPLQCPRSRSERPATIPAKPTIPARPVTPLNINDLDAAAGSDGDEGDSPEVSSTNLLAGPRNVKPYIPRRGEQYMNKEQLEHFRLILNTWKRDLMHEVDRTVLHMKDEAANFPDPNDRATQESEFSLELRTRDRERKLIRKIDEAIKRIEDGTYGYCVETGEEIGIKRLEARPVATLCVEAQERRERREKQYGDRDDRYR